MFFSREEAREVLRRLRAMSSTGGMLAIVGPTRAPASPWLRREPPDPWASAWYDRCGGPYQICQRGPRHLWDEIEDAYRWCDQGEPPLT